MPLRLKTNRLLYLRTKSVVLNAIGDNIELTVLDELSALSRLNLGVLDAGCDCYTRSCVTLNTIDAVHILLKIIRVELRACATCCVRLDSEQSTVRSGSESRTNLIATLLPPFSSCVVCGVLETEYLTIYINNAIFHYSFRCLGRINHSLAQTQGHTVNSAIE